jgi:hypothetical protein
MRTVLGRTAGRASFILVIAGVVGSAALPAVPAAAETKHHRSASAGHHRHSAATQLGTAVKYVRQPDGSVRQVRG